VPVCVYGSPVATQQAKPQLPNGRGRPAGRKGGRRHTRSAMRLSVRPATAIVSRLPHAMCGRWANNGGPVNRVTIRRTDRPTDQPHMVLPSPRVVYRLVVQSNALALVRDRYFISSTVVLLPLKLLASSSSKLLPAAATV